MEVLQVVSLITLKLFSFRSKDDLILVTFKYIFVLGSLSLNLLFWSFINPLKVNVNSVVSWIGYGFELSNLNIRDFFLLINNWSNIKDFEFSIWSLDFDSNLVIHNLNIDSSILNINLVLKVSIHLSLN